jgi:hypothetical protein
VAESRAARRKSRFLLVLRRFEGGNKAFPLKHLALKITRGEAAKIEIPVREQGVGPLDFPSRNPNGHFRSSPQG